MWTEVQALLQGSSDTSCAYCEDAAVKGIQMLLEGRTSCSLKPVYFILFSSPSPSNLALPRVQKSLPHRFFSSDLGALVQSHFCWGVKATQILALSDG